MLLQFSVNNFRSIKDSATFSMNAVTKDKGNEKTIRNYKILTSSVLYGANATGKSNFFKAIIFMKNMVLNKYRITQSTDTLKHFPYRLSTDTETASSTFEIVFFIDDIKYRYGFEADSEKVYSEWLFQDTKGKEAKLFYRDIDENLLYINKNKFKEGLNIKVLDNHLFIWKCDQEGGGISSSILRWFNKVNLIDGSDKDGYFHLSIEKIEDPDYLKKVVSLLKIADLGINNISVEKQVIDSNLINNLPIPTSLKNKLLSDKSNVKSIKINTQHQKYDNDLKSSGVVNFEIDNEESMGTQQFFFISSPILDTLQSGKILLIDEFGSSLHPMLTKHLIEMFNDKTINTNNAQLMFVTHDTNMLDNTLFRRDQIWFTEKDYYGSTHLYSLAEHKNIRPSENFQKNYLEGKYGAIPFLGNFNFMRDL
ncbi:MAG: ATP-binding protein [gamma proteobacterium symbiont of Taylorina sp.]|nr:ATP-binding protein [gamma proteobacterium symbiont of Taylorina sp.]